MGLCFLKKPRTYKDVEPKISMKKPIPISPSLITIRFDIPYAKLINENNGSLSGLINKTAKQIVAAILKRQKKLEISFAYCEVLLSVM